MNFKLALIAIFLIVGCAIAQVQQEEPDSKYGTDESKEYARDTSNPCSPYGGSSGSATSAPTSKPTSAATSAPTSKPTSAATSAPTSKPTSAATSAPTSKPTSAPTSSATSKPTSKPTSAATAAPTTKPTTAPTTKPSSTTGTSTTGLCDITATSSEPLKILVPLYSYPGSDWTTVANAASSASIIAIINPSSGPLSSVDSTWSSYITTLHSAGVEIIGYLHTSYGARAIADVKSDIDLYASKYSNLVGIFVDEASADASEVSYYEQVYSYAIGKGYTQVILNPGTQPDSGYLAVSTSIVIFEDAGSKLSSTTFSSWVTCAPSSSEKAGYKYRFAGIGYGVSSSSGSSLLSTMESKGMGLVYVTDGASGCCTYNTLSSYFATEASAVKSLNA